MGQAITQDIFNKIANSSSTGGGNHFRPAKYLVEIVKIVAERKFKGAMFIVETKVLQAVSTNAVNPKTNQPVIPNAVDSAASWVVNLDKAAGPGNVKAFVMAAFDEPEESLSGEAGVKAIADVCSSTQPCVGMRMWVEFFDKPVQSKPGEFFTAAKWDPLKMDSAELENFKARRKALGLAA